MRRFMACLLVAILCGIFDNNNNNNLFLCGVNAEANICSTYIKIDGCGSNTCPVYAAQFSVLNSDGQGVTYQPCPPSLPTGCEGSFPDCLIESNQGGKMTLSTNETLTIAVRAEGIVSKSTCSFSFSDLTSARRCQLNVGLTGGRTAFFTLDFQLDNIDHGEPCAESTTCESDTCKGGRCCHPYAASFGQLCTACDASGGCSQCTTGKCGSPYCCAPGTSSRCTRCGYNGQCTACASPYTLSNGYCYYPGTAYSSTTTTTTTPFSYGRNCAYNYQCPSGKCGYPYCCRPGVSSRCASCNYYGSCVACYSGYTLFDGNCYYTSTTTTQSPSVATAYARTCSYSSQCESYLCRGSYCCNSGVSSACESCNYLGQCSSCQSGYYVQNGNCIYQGSAYAGDSCVSDGVCQSGFCSNYRCCSGYVNGCTSCDVYGNCDRCASGLQLDDNGECSDIRSAYDGGYYCDNDEHCSSGICRESSCCNYEIDTLCTACDAYGQCTAFGDSPATNSKSSSSTTSYIIPIAASAGAAFFLFIVIIIATAVRRRRNTTSRVGVTHTVAAAPIAKTKEATVVQPGPDNTRRVFGLFWLPESDDENSDSDEDDV
ncbi:hypothetical protein PTSG_09118 [Salpingoeca rosetta]|uniref:TNFR-Cys domain-containing protein n=1 Tax=Salpingoeca rosetta (strain ATCC 50818 / BSB-021) TaxID=946362 RepID=F2UMS3_SALR5|nr:uncharacterized protein PTSG_09118 [Salpingoeca rosetta]EGD78422.1 hypothetical protein PTSG_09118 [Salpingoeca rosetta]|eukprot:XP_004989371.1 hypothetical protein PTSG_09118 [Salpingoeca rosetta]